MNEVNFYPQLWKARVDFSVEVRQDCRLQAYLEGMMLKYPWGSYEGLLNETVHQAIAPTRNYVIGEAGNNAVSFLSVPTNGYESGAKYWIFDMKDLEGTGFWIPFDEPQKRLQTQEHLNLENLIDLKLRRAQLIPPKTVEYLRDKARKKKMTAQIKFTRQPIETVG